MNKKVLLGYVAFAIFIVIVAILFKPKAESSSSISSSSKSVLMGSDSQPLYSNGNCTKDSECAPAGCSAHMCSSDSGLITDCMAIENHPKDQNYSCGCVSNKCMWSK